MNFDCNKTWQFKYDFMDKNIKQSIRMGSIDSLTCLNTQINLEYEVSDLLDLIIIVMDGRMKEYEF